MTVTTLPYILERCRDPDAMCRRLVYARQLSQLIDFRILSLDQREMILRSGIWDRDERVRDACLAMVLHTWIPQSNNNIIEVWI